MKVRAYFELTNIRKSYSGAPPDPDRGHDPPQDVDVATARPVLGDELGDLGDDVGGLVVFGAPITLYVENDADRPRLRNGQRVALALDLDEVTEEPRERPARRRR